jgi:hypothetical protein
MIVYIVFLTNEGLHSLGEETKDEILYQAVKDSFPGVKRDRSPREIKFDYLVDVLELDISVETCEVQDESLAKTLEIIELINSRLPSTIEVGYTTNKDYPVLKTKFDP